MTTKKELESLALQVAKAWGRDDTSVPVRVRQETREEAVGGALVPVLRWTAAASNVRRARGDDRDAAMSALADELRDVLKVLSSPPYKGT